MLGPLCNSTRWTVKHGAFLGMALVFLVGWTQAAEPLSPALEKTPSTHKQKTVVTVASAKEGSKLEDFCVDSKGQILALLGPGSGDSDGSGSPLAGVFQLLTGSAAKPSKFDTAVHVFDASGTLIEKWPVGFPGQAINTAPDGTILIGGDGHIARFDLHGTKLHDAESPQMTYISTHPEQMRERAQEQLESDRAMYADQIKEFEDQVKEVTEAKKKQQEGDAPKDDASSDEDAGQFAQNEAYLKQILGIYKEQLKRLEQQTVEETVEQVTTRAKRINAICGSDADVFVTCPAMQGYGYGVWRTDKEFGQAKEIVKSLSGCCGQMDVQCANGELYVCENSKHRVAKFDREGKELAHFGKRARDEEDPESFGGCCNPMNLCFNKNGELYVSESNGVVKRFTPAGEFVGVAGVADVEPGCKNSCVAATADDKHLFYIDIQKSQIIVLARQDASAEK